MDQLVSIEPSEFEIILIWQMAFIGFSLAKLNKEKWVERLGFVPLLFALWMTVH